MLTVPFFSGGGGTFVSYRVAEDAALANSLYDQLQGKTWTDDEGNQHVMEVFLDSRRLELAENWKDSFMYALNHSCLVVPIVSEACLKVGHMGGNSWRPAAPWPSLAI